MRCTRAVGSAQWLPYGCCHTRRRTAAHVHSRILSAATAAYNNIQLSACCNALYRTAYSTIACRCVTIFFFSLTTLQRNTTAMYCTQANTVEALHVCLRFHFKIKSADRCCLVGVNFVCAAAAVVRHAAVRAYASKRTIWQLALCHCATFDRCTAVGVDTVQTHS